MARDAAGQGQGQGPAGEGGRPSLSEAELAALRVLWERGPSTVREVNDTLAGQGRTWAYTTVQTLLQRLRGKGCVDVEPEAAGLAHRYRAVASREDLVRDGLRDLADRYCDGTPAPLVLTLVEGHRFTPDELARLRALLDQQAKKRPDG